MGFFAPLFLAGLAALGLPLWLHLLRRHKIEPRAFSSLMFFERRTQSSVRHRRLRFYTLLALRLAMLALLALLFAQPFIKRTAAGGAGKRVMIIAVDRSLSMRHSDGLAEAKRQALSAVDSMSGGDLAQVVALGSRTETLTEPVADKSALRAAINSIGPGDSAGSYGEFTRFIRAQPASLNLAVDAHLFSDMQNSALPSAFADLALTDRTKLTLHRIGDTAPNWTVEAVTAPREVHGSQKVRVQAVIAGFNTQPARRTASLVVNGRIAESKTVEIPPNGRAQVEFNGWEPAYGFNRGEVRIEPADSLPQDDTFLFSTERAETRKVLFVRDARQTPAYFRAALESAAGGAYDIETVTADQAANIDPSRYAFVVLADAASASGGFEERLTGFVQQGGGVLIAAGPAYAARGRIPVIDAKVSETRYSSREGDRFQTAARVDASHPAVRDGSVFQDVRFYRVEKIDTRDARALVRSSDETPLLFEKRVGEGRVLVLASALDNIANDFPLHASFVPFIERVSGYLAGSGEGASSTTVDSVIALRGERDRNASAEVLDPTGKRALDLRQATTAATFTFPSTGFWEVRTAGGRHSMYAVNTDRRESDLTRIPDENLALWSGPDGRSTDGPAVPGSPSEPQRSPLWKYVLIALLALAVTESLVADRFTPAAEAKEPEPLVKREAA